MRGRCGPAGGVTAWPHSFVSIEASKNARGMARASCCGANSRAAILSDPGVAGHSGLLHSTHIGRRGRAPPNKQVAPHLGDWCQAGVVSSELWGCQEERCFVICVLLACRTRGLEGGSGKGRARRSAGAQTETCRMQPRLRGSGAPPAARWRCGVLRVVRGHAPLAKGLARLRTAEVGAAAWGDAAWGVKGGGVRRLAFHA